MLLTVGACQPSTQSATTKAHLPQPPEPHAIAAQRTPGPPAANVPAPSQAGSTLTLPGGERVPVVSIMQLDADPGAYRGLIALAGRVMLSDPARSQFVLLDASMGPSKRASCGGDCMLPLTVALEQYEGSLPVANADVVVLVDVSQAGQETRLEVREVRQGDKVILKKK